MIPKFPELKNLELHDKPEIEAHTKNYPLYSDFEFESLWAWDVKEEMQVSLLNDNLVVRFTDYTTGEPFYSFLGTNKVNETARELLETPLEGQDIPALHLVPEITAEKLDFATFTIQESRDHFDYVCDIQNHVEYPGNGLKAHRKLLRQFKELYPQFEEVHLDLSDERTQRAIADVYRKWDENKGFLTISEAFAYERFLKGASELAHSAVGLKVGNDLVAFHIVSLSPGTCASALFSKANIEYRGIYAALDMVVAKDLLERGYECMNIQQDLGIENLRKVKLSLRPIHLLKKYSVQLRSTMKS